MRGRERSLGFQLRDEFLWRDQTVGLFDDRQRSHPNRPRRRLRDPGTLPPSSRTCRWPTSADERSVQVRCSPTPPVCPVEQGTTARCGHHRDGHHGRSTAPAIPGRRSTARRDSNALSPLAELARCAESPRPHAAPHRPVLRGGRAALLPEALASDSNLIDTRLGGWWRRAGDRGCWRPALSPRLSDRASARFRCARRVAAPTLTARQFDADASTTPFCRDR